MIVWGDSHPTKNYSVVGSDNRLGGRLAAQHLIDGGYKDELVERPADQPEMIRERVYSSPIWYDPSKSD